MKRIVIGNVFEEFNDTSINNFKRVIELSKQEDFTVNTNNPQVVEALEVLCKEENVDVFVHNKGNFFPLSFLTAYDYLGDVYDIIDMIRASHCILGDNVDYSELEKEIKI